MIFEINYHRLVKDEDLPKIDRKLQVRIKKAIETRLTTAPHEYGEPLRKTLKGYWKLRVGDYRIVYRIDKKKLIILVVCHRKDVYDRADSRKK